MKDGGEGGEQHNQVGGGGGVEDGGGYRREDGVGQFCKKAVSKFRELILLTEDNEEDVKFGSKWRQT